MMFRSKPGPERDCQTMCFDLRMCQELAHAPVLPGWYWRRVGGLHPWQGPFSTEGLAIGTARKLATETAI